MEVISLNNISKSFGRKKVLDNISLSVNGGDILGIVGPSGEGKSVLIKIILDFFKQDSGTRIISAPKDKIGFSMQNNSVYEKLTTNQNLEYFSKIFGVQKKTEKKPSQK